MAKPKSPLLSLGAHGTIADTLTFQKRGRDTIAREKPIPKDPYSLPQAYQRWLYKDYAYLWTLQTNSQKQVYRTRASRYHITGFSLWMREHLRDLPDIAAMWHLDEKAGAIAYDSSRNTNHCTIFGATPTAGLIDGAQSLDGLNDRLQAANHPSLNPTELTLELFVNRKGLGAANLPLLAGKYDWPLSGGYALVYDETPDKVSWYVRDSILGPVFILDPVVVGTNTWIHYTATFDGTTMAFYRDGSLIASQPGVMSPATALFDIGFWTGFNGYFFGLIDHVILYNRALDITEAKRHSLRRYPA